MIRISFLSAALTMAVSLSANAQENDDIAAVLARQMHRDGQVAEAVVLIQELADKGVPRAELTMARIFRGGLGVETDLKLALEWYQKAAADGQPQAMYDLARLYQLSDLGLEQDLVRARELYVQAAAMDFAPALNNLAFFYMNGTGGPEDDRIARALFERSVELGYPLGTAEYATILAVGVDLPLDLPRARHLYEIAAAHEIFWAMRDFGEMLERGEGGPVDLDGAERWYRRAAEKGNAKAAYDMAQMLWANTAKMPDRLVEALAWCFFSETLSPDQEGISTVGLCSGPAAAYKPDEVAEAREIAKTL